MPAVSRISKQLYDNFCKSEGRRQPAADARSYLELEFECARALAIEIVIKFRLHDSYGFRVTRSLCVHKRGCGRGRCSGGRCISLSEHEYILVRSDLRLHSRPLRLELLRLLEQLDRLRAGARFQSELEQGLTGIAHGSGHVETVATELQENLGRLRESEQREEAASEARNQLFASDSRRADRPSSIVDTAGKLPSESLIYRSCSGLHRP